MYDITFQQIETFLMVAKCTNLSKAAELLSYTQPALSKTLRKLENSLGTRLFSRSNQGMWLTADGDYFLSIIEPLYKSINQSIRNVQLSQAPAEILRIMAPSVFDHSDDFDVIKDVIRKYEGKYPNVQIRERLCDITELRQALYFGKADFVISEDFAIRDMQDIISRPINRINMYLLISSKHHLAQSETLDFSALSGQTFYTIRTLNEEIDMNAQLDICSQLGIKPNRIEIMPNFQTTLHMVNLGRGVTLSAKLKNMFPDDNVRYYPVKLKKTPCIMVAWRESLRKCHAENFINLLPEFYNA